MASLRLALSHARRHCSTSTSTVSPPQLSLLLRHSFLGFNRHLSSSSEFDSNPNPNPNPPSSETPKRSIPQSIPLQAVSYPVKPKDPSKPDDPSPQPTSPPPPRPPRINTRDSVNVPNANANANVNENEKGEIWTREDMRYVKNVVPTISPVSYPTRVANLPEDRGPEPMEAGKEGEVVKGSEEIERERKVIEADHHQMLKRVLKVQEVEKVPFPTLIKVEQNKSKEVLDLAEAIREVKANAKRNFDETIEAHVRLGIDRRRTDQQVNGTMTLPHGIGKVVKVAVFAEGATADEARAAGADVVGGVELVEGILNGGIKIDFDKCITTPVFMPRLGKIAKILGKRGLMPNPKRGTIVSDVSGGIKEAKQGRVDFKMDKSAIVHVGLGKVSFPEENLRENIGSFVNALLLAKPVGLKKTSKYAGYVNSFHLCSTMGPGFAVSIQSLSRAADHFNKVQLK